MTTKHRPSVGMRTVCCAMLLVLLAVCGYAGTQEPSVQTAAVPVSRQILTGKEISASSVADTRTRLDEARRQEIALLDSVLADPDAGSETHRSALEQKTSLAKRMEHEAQLEAALSYMGYGSLAVICGAQTVTVFVPVETALEEAGRVRIIDEAASQTGFAPEDVKIILAKK